MGFLGGFLHGKEYVAVVAAHLHQGVRFAQVGDGQVLCPGTQAQGDDGQKKYQFFHFSVLPNAKLAIISKFFSMDVP